jgi:hypothetical protein
MKVYDPWLIDTFCKPIDHFIMDGNPIYDPACWAYVTMLPLYVLAGAVLVVGLAIWAFTL